MPKYAPVSKSNVVGDAKNKTDLAKDGTVTDIRVFKRLFENEESLCETYVFDTCAFMFKYKKEEDKIMVQQLWDEMKNDFPQKPFLKSDLLPDKKHIDYIKFVHLFIQEKLKDSHLFTKDVINSWKLRKFMNFIEENVLYGNTISSERSKVTTNYYAHMDKVHLVKMVRTLFVKMIPGKNSRTDMTFYGGLLFDDCNFLNFMISPLASKQKSAEGLIKLLDDVDSLKAIVQRLTENSHTSDDRVKVDDIIEQFVSIGDSGKEVSPNALEKIVMFWSEHRNLTQSNLGPMVSDAFKLCLTELGEQLNIDPHMLEGNTLTDNIDVWILILEKFIRELNFPVF